MNAPKRNIFQFILVGFLLLWFASCKPARELASVEAKPMSTAKLLKKVEQNAFDYNYFTIKRINCQFETEESKTNFKVTLKAQKNKQILVSISKINIPVGRVLLTPDSVKYVNYLDRNYFLDDYSYLSSFLNIDLDFNSIQAIISNHAFSYRNDEKNKDFKTFDSFIESGMHVLQSEKDRKIEKIEEKGKTNKIERRLKRLNDDALIVQKMYFNPANYTLTRLIIDDKSNERQMEMTFEDFTKVKSKEYPGLINMNFSSPASDVKLKARMAGFSTEKITSFSLKIPDKYQEIKVN